MHRSRSSSSSSSSVSSVASCSSSRHSASTPDTTPYSSPQKHRSHSTPHSEDDEPSTTARRELPAWSRLFFEEEGASKDSLVLQSSPSSDRKGKAPAVVTQDGVDGKELEKLEPLLQESGSNRFVLFPIQYPQVRALPYWYYSCSPASIDMDVL